VLQLRAAGLAAGHAVAPAAGCQLATGCAALGAVDREGATQGGTIGMAEQDVHLLKLGATAEALDAAVKALVDGSYWPPSLSISYDHHLSAHLWRLPQDCVMS
jgi:hypothetical protein